MNAFLDGFIVHSYAALSRNMAIHFNLYVFVKLLQLNEASYS